LAGGEKYYIYFMHEINHASTEVSLIINSLKIGKKEELGELIITSWINGGALSSSVWNAAINKDELLYINSGTYK